MSALDHLQAIQNAAAKVLKIGQIDCLCLNLVTSLQVSLKVLFWVCSSFPCPQSHSALLFTHTFFPTTAMQMTLNLFLVFSSVWNPGANMKHPFLTQETAQFLVQALVISRLDYCTLFLAGVPAGAIRPLQNAGAWVVFNSPKFSHTILRCLHWLLVAARIRMKTLVFAYCAANYFGPSYIQDMVKPYTPAHPLSSAPANRLATPSRRGGHSHRSTKSWLFAVLASQ